MRVSIIIDDGTTTYTESLTPVETEVEVETDTEFEAALSEATDALSTSSTSSATETLSTTSEVSSTTDALSATSSTDSMTDAEFEAMLSEATEILSTLTSTSSTTEGTMEAIFEEAAETYGVDANLLKAIAKQESNFDASATSSSGAMGVMQLMPSTAESLGVEDPYDAYQNIMGGAKYISQLLERYDGDVTLALAAYNAGSGNVDKYGGVPPFTETQNYVAKVEQYYEEGVTIPDSANNLSGTTEETSEVELSEEYKKLLTDLNTAILNKLSTVQS